MDHKFLPDVAIADIAFEARGKTLEELIENCGYALMEAMADLKKIKPKRKKIIVAEGETEEKLLYNFLEELVYIKDVNGLLFSKFRARVNGEKGLKLEVDCTGDTLENIGAGNMRNDVKAITMHMFKISRENEGYKATVVVDI